MYLVTAAVTEGDEQGPSSMATEIERVWGRQCFQSEGLQPSGHTRRKTKENERSR